VLLKITIKIDKIKLFPWRNFKKKNNKNVCLIKTSTLSIINYKCKNQWNKKNISVQNSITGIIRNAKIKIYAS